MSKPDDFVEGLGALVLDHRLKRLMQRLLDAAAELYEAQGVPFKPRWVSTFLLLARERELTVTEIARRLRITHPAVIQITNGMSEAGLVEFASDARDARRRLLRLSRKGRALRPRMEAIWNALASEQERLFAECGVAILPVLGDVENLLDEKSLAARVAARLDNEPEKRGRR